MVYNRSDRKGGVELGWWEEGNLGLKGRVKWGAGGAAQLGD